MEKLDFVFYLVHNYHSFLFLETLWWDLTMLYDSCSITLMHSQLGYASTVHYQVADHKY